VRDAWWLWEYI